MECRTIWSLVFSVVAVFPILVDASGVFELKLERFENNFLTADRSGACCKDRAGQCTLQCNTYFRICLKHYQTNITPNSPCTFGSFQTEPAVTATTGNGLDTLPEKHTTISFPFDFTWPETFSLIVEAWHQPLPAKPDPFPVEDNIGVLEDQLLAQLTAHRNLKADTNWTESTFTANSSQLTFSYRVVCDEKYYGAGCSDLCRPRDDGFGHYTCTENGTLVCLDGWTGQYCTQAVCAAGCNAQRGYCDLPFECKCRTGWQGKDCSECIRYPGCRKGTCQMPWQCNCDEGWGGLFCDQDLNYCTHHRPCGNGGTCTNTGQGSYTCKCPEEFTGLNCEVRKDQCEVEPCQNGAICRTAGPGNYTCECLDGFTGKNCDIPSKSCSDSPCLNDGLCRQNPTKGYSCLCKPGFEGRNCERDRNDCETAPCRNGGQCHDLVNSFSCTCPAGYAGATCQTKTSPSKNSPTDCTVSLCMNGGTCTAASNGPAGTATCTCLPGYSGPTCQYSSFDKCSDSPCHHGASCEDLRGGDFVCHCPQGYTGKLCDTLDANSLEEKASMARLESRTAPRESSWTTTALIVLVCSLVLVLGLVLAMAVLCVLRRRSHPSIKSVKDPLAAQINFNMNNFQRVAPTSTPKEWKPTVTYQTESPEREESHYKVLPKRNNANYVCSSAVYGGTASRVGHSSQSASSSPASSSSSSASSANTDIYMKVMVTPPPSYGESYYQSPRKSSASYGRTTERFAEFELAENVQRQYEC